MTLEVCYKDDFIVAINKPHGLLVHRSNIAKDATEFALQLLRDQLDQLVYPIHRLDRKTSGVLLFGLDSSTHRAMQKLFAENRVSKNYLAIVRGYTDDEGEIDYPLRNDSGKLQEAKTNYKTLQRTEIPLPFGKFATSRYSLVEIYPQTGRMHQIRKHFAHILHPIIADRPHGCNKQNKLFKEHFNMSTMMLHAQSVSFEHPITSEMINIRASYHNEFKRIIQELQLNN